MAIGAGSLIVCVMAIGASLILPDGLLVGSLVVCCYICWLIYSTIMVMVVTHIICVAFNNTFFTLGVWLWASK
jgi:hypothetical protein